MFSSTKRKRSHQEQLAEDSLFLNSPSVDELQTIQKRKDLECSRDTQVKNQALYDYVDGLTITMNVIQPRGRKESKKQAAEIMQDVMLSSQGGQPSSAIHRRRMCYQCKQKGHYAKSCPQNLLSPVAPVQDLSPIPRTSGDETHLISENCSKQDALNDQDQQQVIPVSSDLTKHEQSKKGPKEYLQGRVHHVSAETIRDDSSVILGMLLSNSFPASVLIDPRATHSFISTQFAAKHEILKLPMRKRMVVKS